MMEAFGAILWAASLCLMLLWLIALTWLGLSLRNWTQRLQDTLDSSIQKSSREDTRRRVEEVRADLEVLRRAFEDMKRESRHFQGPPKHLNPRGEAVALADQSSSMVSESASANGANLQHLDAEFLERLMESFNHLAANYSSSRLESFRREFAPRPAATTLDGQVQLSDLGMLWLFESPSSPGRAAILPGGRVLEEWDLKYRHMNGFEARKLLKSLYELVPGGSVGVNKPAIVQSLARESGNYDLVVSGILRGI